MENIYNYSLSKLEELVVSLGYKKFNASQIFDWIYKKRIKSFTEMTNVKKELIDYLDDHFTLGSIDILAVEKDTDVAKFLFKLNDGQKIEAV